MSTTRILEKPNFKIGVLTYHLRIEQTIVGGGQPAEYNVELSDANFTLDLGSVWIGGLADALAKTQARASQVNPSNLSALGYTQKEGYITLVPDEILVAYTQTLMGDTRHPLDHEYALDVIKAIEAEVKKIDEASA